jgi:hypothetical protein
MNIKVSATRQAQPQHIALKMFIIFVKKIKLIKHMKILHFIIFIADPGSCRSMHALDPLIFIADPGSGSSYFYRGSGIPDPLILSRIYQGSGSSPWF